MIRVVLESAASVGNGILLFAKNSTIPAVRRQKVEYVHLAQAVPLIGPMISVPTALYSGVIVIVMLARAAFQRLSGRDNETVSASLADARDFTVLCVNSVLNIYTLGTLNLMIVVWSISDDNATLYTSNEKLRIATQALRTTNEALRTANENLYIANENFRIANENLQIANENLRSNLERLRFSPQMGTLLSVG
jgi:hypothetical protein